MIDDQLPSDARALLAAGRERMGPDAATIGRLRGRVEAAVIAGATTMAGSAAAATAAPATSAAAPVAAASAATATASVAAKSFALKVVLVALGTGAGAYVAHDVAMRDSTSSEVASPPLATPSTSADDMADIAPPIAIAAPETVPVDVAPVVEDSPAVLIEKPAPAPRTTEPPRATLAREIELVDRATIALRAGDLDAALAALQAYGAEAADGGQLAQDAEALHIEVLCRTRDAAAAGELAAFDKRWPHSPQRTHLTTVCTEASK